MTTIPLLSGLLSYIEEIERLNKSPAFVVPTDVFSLGEDALEGLPGVTTDLELDGPVWLKVPRLQEVPVPPLPVCLVSEIVLSASPTVAPAWAPLPDEKDPLAAAELVALQVELDEYMASLWRPWARTEAPRRKTVALYKSLFALHQKLAGEGEAPLELVWGMGLALWDPAPGKTVGHPLITQACFIDLDKDSFALSIRPRDVEPQLELDCYVELEVPGVRDLEAFWAERRQVSTYVNPWQPDTFLDVLRAGVGYLDPAAELKPIGPSGGSFDRLTLSPDWVLFARKRSTDVFVADVRRFQEEIAGGSPIPGVVEAFVTEAADTLGEVPAIRYRGLSDSSSEPGVQELFFPLPYNAEQVDIISKLEHSAGVVVQGPPGTGKTHTIANIVSHYLARGMRVLVTSKGDTALNVLQEKLPDGIRDLSVALLANERAGVKQFEHSIQQIASKVSSIRPLELEATIAQLEGQLSRTHAGIARLDADIAEFSRRNAELHVLAGKDYTAEELARFVVATQERFAWFTDPLEADSLPSFSEADVEAVRQARRRLGADLAHLGDTFLAPDKLPAWSLLLGHRTGLLRERELALQLARREVAPLLLGYPTQEVLAEALSLTSSALVCRESLQDDVLSRVAALPPGVQLFEQIEQMAALLITLEQQRLDHLAAAVQVDDSADCLPEFVAAVSRLAQGKPAFALGVGLFANKSVKQHIEACLVRGAKPVGAEAWQAVARLVAWRAEVRALIHRWNAVSGEFGLPSASLTLAGGFREVSQLLGNLWQTIQFHRKQRPQVAATANALFGPAACETHTCEDLAQLEAALKVHLELARLADQAQRMSEFAGALGKCQGVLAAAMQAFLHVRLGNAAEQEDVLAADWLALVQQTEKLTGLTSDFHAVEAFSALLDADGLSEWASLISNEPTKTTDQVLPADWREAWSSKVAAAILDEIDGHDRIRAMFVDRAALADQLARIYRELVAERAWLGVYRNSTDKTKQALQSFLTSVQALGSGTGVRAGRHRRAAREAMEKAYLSVPCWVLPQWRISETLPAEMGLFDLVIIDEASQSDISSLPAILRGKKLLVVGDHKQVSPAAVGVSEAKITAAYGRLLKSQPHGAHMTSDKSVYDLARVVFAGQSVMLKEHFRCVPEIIEYSNREFYNGEIRALRVPREDERLDPPLVDVFVEGGVRVGDKNRPEALAVVKEIEAIIRDPATAGKSIGVVTLLGQEQARLISELIAFRVPPEDVIARDIVVGQPPAFQGRERDIILLSMVQVPGDRSFSSALTQQQRLNVAMSRARDRMYLFRSVPDDYFPPDSVSGRLVAHFQTPYRSTPAHTAASRELCESGFERAMFDELSARGYRLTPQVRSGGYRIDLVVEGSKGRRLAVECDGDQYHTPDRWAADMARQRVLERAGWTFWRCFASSFTRRRQDVLLDLLGTLDQLGIEPLELPGAAETLVEARRVADEEYMPL